MDKIIRKLYGNMLKEEAGADKISQETQNEITGLLEDLEKQMGGQEYIEYRDMVFLAASAAEENGFVKGFKYAFRLFTECARE